MKKYLFAIFGLTIALGFLAQVLPTFASGVYLPVQGGTGSSSTPQSGEVLIGNSSGTYTPAYITCSGSCSIATSSGAISISVSGGGSGGAISISPVSGTSTSFSIIGDGTFFKTVATATSTIEVEPATTSVGIWTNNGLYLIAANNLSDLTNSSTARTNLGLGSAALQNTAYFLVAGNNLSDLTSTSSARTNIGYSGVANQITISGTGAIGFATTSISQFVNDKGYLTGNQTITIIATGDATGTASGTTTITHNLTITGLEGKALPSLATGTLKYTGGAWTFDGNTYLLSGVNVTTTAPLGGGGPLTSAGLTLTCSSCLTGNQTITLTGAVTGSGATSIATTYTTSTLFGFFSATSPIIYNSSTGAFSWTNSNNYISSISINGNSGTSFQIAAGSGVTSTVSGTTTTLTLNLNALCSGNQFLSGVTATGTGICGTPTGGASSTNVYGVSPIVVSQVGVNATASCPTCIATNTGAWVGTWQGTNSTTFYLASNPSGYISNAITTIDSLTNATETFQGSGPITVSTSSPNLHTIGCSTCYLTSNPSGFTTTTIQSVLNSLSATSPVTYNSSTGVIAWTNSNNYITLASLSALSPISYNSSTGQFSCPSCITVIPTSTITINGITTSTFSFLAGGTGLSVASSGNSITYTWTNPGYITTSTYNASMTVATAAPLTGGGSLTNGTTLNLACATCIATNTGNWAGTWQGYNHTDFLASSTNLAPSTTIPTVYVSTLNGSTGTYNLYATGPLSIATGTASTTLSCPTCLTGNQTITLTGAVTGNGATTISTVFTTSTLYSEFSGTSPITFSASTGAIGCATCITSAVTSANSETGGVNWLASGPGLSVASSGQNITYTYSSSSLGLGTMSVINSPVPVANGGTGTSTAPTDSQVLSASGTTPTWKTITPGTNITITTSTTAITISAAGGGSTNGTITPATTTDVAYYSASTTVNGTSSFTYTAGAVNGSTTVQVGTSSSPGCISVIDHVASSTYYYMYFNNGQPFWDTQCS